MSVLLRRYEFSLEKKDAPMPPPGINASESRFEILNMVTFSLKIILRWLLDRNLRSEYAINCNEMFACCLAIRRALWTPEAFGCRPDRREAADFSFFFRSLRTL
jgi:hypothetical protein